MSIELRCVKALGALRGATPDDIAKMKDLPDGVPIKVEVTLHPRNERAHRWYFGLLGVVAENTDYNIDQVLTLIKIGIGHVDTMIMPGSGEVVYQPRSIAWSKMDEETFRRFVDRSVAFILERILPGTSSEDLEREVFARLGIDLSNLRESGASLRGGRRRAAGGEDGDVHAPSPSPEAKARGQ